MTGRLPIGVTLGTLGVDARWWLDSARRLDEAGYAAIWAWDHFVSKGERTTPVLEAWTVLSAAAALTGSARIGPFVLNVMNRHPALVAKMAATLQQLSGGRLVLALGVGGYPGEHEAYGIEFPAIEERVDRLIEAVGVIRALWSGGPVTLDAPHYPLRDAWAHPVPRPAPPILIGAQTPRGVRLAAALGDGWAPEAPVFEALLPRYLEALAVEGRSRADQRIVVGFSGGRSGVDSVVGTPFVEVPAEAVAEWVARGADEVNVTARTTADVDALVSAAGRW